MKDNKFLQIKNVIKSIDTIFDSYKESSYDNLQMERLSLYGVIPNSCVGTNDGSIIFNNNFDSNQEVVISNNSEGYFLINLPFKASIDDNFSLSLQYNIND